MSIHPKTKVIEEQLSRVGKTVREFPVVEEGQVVVTYNHRLGYALNSEGETFRGGDKDEVHFVCDSLEDARRHARDASERMPHVVCVLHASDGSELELIGNDEYEQDRDEVKRTWLGRMISKAFRK